MFEGGLGATRSQHGAQLVQANLFADVVQQHRPDGTFEHDDPLLGDVLLRLYAKENERRGGGIAASPSYALTFSRSAYFLRIFWALGATTNMQYGCVGLFSR